MSGEVNDSNEFVEQGFDLAEPGEGKAGSDKVQGQEIKEIVTDEMDFDSDAVEQVGKSFCDRIKTAKENLIQKTREQNIPGYNGKHPVMCTRQIPTSELISDLYRIPILIQQKETELVRLRKESDEAVLQLKLMEARKYAEVEAEKVDDKPAFSNESKRRAETEARLEKDTEYTVIKAKHDKLRDEITELTIHLDFIGNRFKACRSIALLIGDAR